MIYVASCPDLPYVLSDFTDIATLPFAKDDRVKDEAMPIITRVTLNTSRRRQPRGDAILITLQEFVKKKKNPV